MARIACQSELNFLSLDQNFIEIYPDNLNTSLTWTVFHFPSELELPRFYSTCIIYVMGQILIQVEVF